MKQTKLLFLLLLLMAIPATMQAYTQGEIVKKRWQGNNFHRNQGGRKRKLQLY